MKLLIFAILLTVAVVTGTVISCTYVNATCQRLQWLTSDPAGVLALEERWERFSSLAVLITPYELIRNADVNCRQYLALVEANADTADIEASREAFIASVQQIKRLHSLSWELLL